MYSGKVHAYVKDQFMLRSKNVLYMFAHYLDIMLYPNNKLNCAEYMLKTSICWKELYKEVLAELKLTKLHAYVKTIH